MTASVLKKRQYTRLMSFAALGVAITVVQAMTTDSLYSDLLVNISLLLSTAAIAYKQKARSTSKIRPTKAEPSWTIHIRFFIAVGVILSMWLAVGSSD